VSQHDAAGRGADRRSGFDEELRAEAEHVTPEESRVERDRRDRDPERRGLEAAAEADGHRHREDERREGEDRIHDAHEHRVRPAADNAGDQADRAPDRGSDENDDRAHRERDLRSHVEAGEHVPADIVGPHRVRRRGRLQIGPDVQRQRILRPDERAEHGEEDEDREQRHGEGE
jgi:hypothetical protein